MNQLEKALSKVPLLPILLLGIGYLVYDYYDWLQMPTSELGQRKTFLKQTKVSLEAAKKKLTEAQEFYKNLDIQRLRIRQLTTQLENTKIILSTEIDIANFIKMITLEAKKLRLTVKSIKPANRRTRDYYEEHPFELSLKGAYVQKLLFFDRISKLQNVVRIGDFAMKPTGSPYTKYVELDGSVQLLTYKYLGTHADEVLNKPEMKSSVDFDAPAPGQKDEKASKGS